jgi:hypothetical protein
LRAGHPKQKTTGYAGDLDWGWCVVEMYYPYMTIRIPSKIFLFKKTE